MRSFASFDQKLLPCTGTFFYHKATVIVLMVEESLHGGFEVIDVAV